jgi:D-glycerate 3-kinase
MTPVHRALAQRIAERAVAKGQGACFVVGLCGAQGSGKSTTASILADLLEADGLEVAALSLDDLYLPRAEREALSRNVHPLLRTRGVPGTHDVALGLEVFAALRAPGRVALPSFDKARDDRRPRAEWPMVEAPVDVLLFEGWCVGARPQQPEALERPINALEREEDSAGVWRCYVNDALARAYLPLFAQIEHLILLAAPGFEVVHRWRMEQERELALKVRAEGSTDARLMNEAQIARFISHYERLTRHILDEAPARADVIVRLDEARRMWIERG